MGSQPQPYSRFRAIYLIELKGFSLMEASLMEASLTCKVWCTAGQLSRPSTLFYFFTNDLPLALKKACVSMYADDSTIYTSATTANEVTETLTKDLQSVLE